MIEEVDQVAKLVITRIDQIHGSSWRFNLFRTNKYLAQLVNEGTISDQFLMEHYHALTEKVQDEANRRRDAAKQ